MSSELWLNDYETVILVPDVSRTEFDLLKTELGWWGRQLQRKTLFRRLHRAESRLERNLPFTIQARSSKWRGSTSLPVHLWSHKKFETFEPERSRHRWETGLGHLHRFGILSETVNASWTKFFIRDFTSYCDQWLNKKEIFHHVGRKFLSSIANWPLLWWFKL